MYRCIYIYIYIYPKARSAAPPPCQRELQPGWTEVVLSDGSVFLFSFLCGLALEVVRSFGAHLYYIQKLFWKSARGFTACTGGNSAGISASTAWVDALWLGFANMLSTCFYRILQRFSMLFEPVPTSRVLLGEENEALLHLAGQSIDFWWFWLRFRLQFGALGPSFGYLF